MIRKLLQEMRNQGLTRGLAALNESVSRGYVLKRQYVLVAKDDPPMQGNSLFKLQSEEVDWREVSARINREAAEMIIYEVYTEQSALDRWGSDKS